MFALGVGLLGLMGMFASAAAQAQGATSQTGSETLSEAPNRLEWIRYADQRIREVFGKTERARYEETSRLYLALLALLDDTLSAAERAVLEPHLEGLRQILPPELTRRLDRPPVAADLLAWWRSQDARPATARNERIEEHLERWAYAHRHYTYEDRLDDRGRIYIRYGPPARQTRVRLDDPRYRRLVLDREPTLSPLEFPENEFWVYSQVDRNLHYLFIRRPGEGFRIGSSEELIPRPLRNSPRRAEALLRTLEEIYRQLALYHIDYGALYDEVANYVATLESQVPQRPELPPTAFGQRMLLQVQNEEAYLLERREQLQAPPYTNVLDPYETLQIELRWARFLDPDGTTRTELYWSGPARSFEPSRAMRRRLERARMPLEQAEYLLVGSIVQTDSAYQPRVRHYFRHRLAPQAARQREAVLEPRTYTIRGDTGLYHLAFELDQYLLPSRSRVPNLDSIPLLKTYVQRLDSLRALNPNPARLEMSDLMLLEVLQEAALSARPVPAGATRPYPYSSCLPGAPLALYYEVYHLKPNAAGQARVRTTYEVLRRVPTGPLGTEFRLERTSGATTHITSGSTLREYLLLDTRNWTPGEVTIRLQITDLESGQHTERELKLLVIEPT
ncbi:MAG: GWxTD domain-containing protein [Bacteroidetes bacterium]|nr:GWxTD domain-containing protein [Bacteroidota bacterium]